MPGFLYFLPFDRPVSRQTIREHGLFPVLGTSWQCADVTLDGVQGRIVAHTSFPSALFGVGAGLRELQTWVDRNVPGAATGARMGWYAEAAPAPADLAEHQPDDARSLAVLMGDGRKWDVPVLCPVVGKSGLPYRMIWAHGEWSAAMLADYVETERVCMMQRQNLMSELAPLPSRESQARAVCEALRINYRVAEPEVSALGLLTDASMSEALKAMIDFDSMVVALRAVGRSLESQQSQHELAAEVPPA